MSYLCTVMLNEAHRRFSTSEVTLHDARSDVTRHEKGAPPASRARMSVMTTTAATDMLTELCLLRENKKTCEN